MELSEILNFVLGGTLLATVIGIVTLKAKVKQANAEAEKAQAEAETVRIDNTEQATRILIENIVEPLNGTRKDLQATKREMARLRKAIDTANSCKHNDDCPVLRGVREHPKDNAEGNTDGSNTDDDGQSGQRSPPDTDGNGSEVGGETGDTG